MFPKTQDHMIDRLLGAPKGGPGERSRLCRAFDADLASAYVERALTATEAARYEQHLAGCSPCRKAVIALTRLAAAESVPAVAAAARPDRAVAGAAGGSWAQRWLHALTVPQWAMVAAAVVVLAVTLPLALSNRAKSTDQLVAPAPPAEQLAVNPTPRDPAQSASPDGAPAASASAASGLAQEPGATARKAGASDQLAPASGAENKEAQAEPPAGGQIAQGVAQTPPADSKSDEQRVAKDAAPAPPAASASQPPAAAPLPKIDEDNAKKVAAETAAATTTLKPSQVGGEERPKAEKAVRPEIAPPPVRSAQETEMAERRRDGEAGVSGPGVSRFRGRTEAERARGPLKIGGHHFFLRDGVWTDKDYNPGKDMSVVTLIRDSEVYRDLLAKEKKIKPFLTGFAADQRVIFIFKDKVYKLIPQDMDR